jgi:hypothetical protein
MGHSLGLGHAHKLGCTDAAGHPVTLSSTCAVFEYGDNMSAMGDRSAGTYSAVQLFDLGWIGSRTITVPPSGGAYSLLPIEQRVGGVQALRIPDGPETVWVEYRQPIGVDHGLYYTTQPGQVFVHLQRPDGLTQLGSYIVDMTPDTYDSNDGGMLVGSTWTNPLGHLRITVDSADSSSAHITVTTTWVTVPDLSGRSQANASATLAAAGLTMAAHNQVDQSCTSIGRVMDQCPAPGTLVDPGATVDVTIGQRPAPPRRCLAVP